MAKKTKSGTPVQKQKTSLHANHARPNNGFKASYLKRFYGFIAGHLPGSFSEFIIMATVFLLPLFFWPGANTSFELPKVTLFRTMTFLLAAGVIVKRLKRGTADSQGTPDFSRIKLPLVLLALMIISWVVSAALSPAPAIGVFGYYPRFQGLYTLACYIIFAALFFLEAGSPTVKESRPRAGRRSGIDRILNTIVASSFLVALSAFLQSWGVSWLNYWDVSSFLGRFFGTMGHPDYLASFLVIVIPIQIERILANKGRILSILALSFSLAALYFTLSRAAFLGLFIALLFFLIIATKKLGMKKLFIASLLTPVLLLTALFSINMLSSNDFVSKNTLLSRLVLKDENLRSVQTRLVLWPATVRQIIDSPFYGYGPDSYAITFPKYAPAELNTLENLGDYPDRAHDFLLDYAVQFGIPGLLVFLALIGAVFVKALSFILKRKRDWLLPLALISALTGSLVANLFGFFVTVTWVYFWLILALLLRLVTPEAVVAALRYPPSLRLNPWWREGAKIPRLSSAKKARVKVALFLVAAFTAVTVVFAGGAVVATQDILLFAADLSYRGGEIEAAARLVPQISFYQYRDAVAMTAAGNTTAAADALDRMGKITGNDGLYYLQKGKILTSGKSADKSPEDTNSTASAGDFTSAFSMAIAKMPAYAPVYLAFGKALYDNGQYSTAAEILEKYLNLCPQYYLWKGNLGSHSPEEQQRYRIFYKLNPDFNDVLPILADAYAKSPRTPDNIAKAEYYKNLTYY
jgi:O-antigen ligase/tetratricopeptide (TPR) repeat protein